MCGLISQPTITTNIHNLASIIASNGTLTLANTVSGTGTNFAANTGTLVLGGNNTFAGPTWLLGGTVVITNDSNLGASTAALVFSNAGTLLVLSNATLNASRGLSLASAGGTIDTSNQTTTIAGVITGSGGGARAASPPQ